MQGNSSKTYKGAIMAMAGVDYAIIASDTNLSLSKDFPAHLKDSPQSYMQQIAGDAIFGCAGFYGDVLEWTKLLKAGKKMHVEYHHKKMSTTAIADMLSTILTNNKSKYNILAGLDEEGKGCVYYFDSHGSWKREIYRASFFLQAVLDKVMKSKNPKGLPMPRKFAIEFVKMVFFYACMEGMYAADGIILNIITKDGCETQTYCHVYTDNQ